MSRRGDGTGYLSHLYAAALTEVGTPRHLSRSDGWILQRPIEGTDLHDAMGPYPLFACRDWKALESDVEDLRRDLVSLTVVPDPFGNYSHEQLVRCFPDRVIRFKDHLVADLTKVSNETVPKHHRYYARRALRHLDVEAVADPDASIVDAWTELYATLVRRHSIVGVRAFSRKSFADQLRVPGTVALVAREQGEIVGAHLWFVQGDVAYSHLAAVNERGYELSAAYALHSYALDYFREKVRWLDIGAGAGASGAGDDGLARFKRGWASDSRPVWLCGRIFDHAVYERLCEDRLLSGSAYFPAYRTGEFG